MVHNKKNLRKEVQNENIERLCNCRAGVASCPVSGKGGDITYEAEVEAVNKPNRKYLGSCGTTVRVRIETIRLTLKIATEELLPSYLGMCAI